jgi:hypothetical protein
MYSDFHSYVNEAVECVLFKLRNSYAHYARYERGHLISDVRLAQSVEALSCKMGGRGSILDGIFQIFY